MRRRPLAAALVSALALACGSDPTEAGSSSSGAAGWIDVPGMICADGSGTGIWLSPGTSGNLLIVLSGGGACWAADRCGNGLPWYLGGVPRAFGRSDFAQLQAANWLAGTIVDRSLPGNPFATWTHVFVPYCTGDVHAGADVTRIHGAVTWRHRGRANLGAAVQRIVAEVPRPAKVVVSGFSAGGFGALVAHDLVHAAWDPGHATSLDAVLLDDSGPTFVGTGEMPSQLLAAWWDAWNLASTIGTICSGCETDLSRAWEGLHTRHPADRLALLSTTEDQVMRSFFGLTATSPMPAATFTAGVSGICEKLVPPALDSKAACFRSAGTGHAMLTEPAAYTAGAEPLLGWLGKLVDPNQAWGPAGP